MTPRPGWMARLTRDQRGAALIEFAIVLPFTALLFVGGYQLSDAVSAYRKTTATTRAIADLTTQYTRVNDADLDAILNASQQVLAPYKVVNATLIVSQITIDNSGTAKIDWSRAKNGTPYVANSSFTVPSQFRRNNTTLVVAEVSYRYVPSIASSMLGTFTLKDRIDMNPRKSTVIEKL